MLFANQSGENRGAFNAENLSAFAEQAGLDVEAFDTCLESGKYADLVSSQTQFSQSIGVRSTPSFLVNGVAVVGAQGFDVFEDVIEEQLSLAGE